jgi:hypothetical protein
VTTWCDSLFSSLHGADKCRKCFVNEFSRGNFIRILKQQHALYALDMTCTHWCQHNCISGVVFALISS